MSGKNQFGERAESESHMGLLVIPCADTFYSRLMDIRDYHRKFPDQSGDLLSPLTPCMSS